ncbi:hypothetical protein [Enterococcus raffinosus]|uniref:hypothetical protein n=1 Tax=Enterococcus TaxID=1350 RepID=UPI000763EBCB|nr:hypothetical protein [Enterococcus raffinosus]OJG85781.1 hypothetical protein RV13_GL000852 [Enterococcus raffinosus]GMS53016.1 hypothetical protein NUITMVRE36_00070 [Enterococcus raffinosus]
MTKKKIGQLAGVLFLIVAGIFIGMNWQNWFGEPLEAQLTDVESAEDWTGERKAAQKPSPTIDIPGYEKLQLKADSLEQTVNFHNPENNTCYFKISLWQDPETKLWESKLLAPGKAIYELTLDKTIAAGSYEEAMVKYECFSLENHEPLNGSEIKVTLEVF